MRILICTLEAPLPPPNGLRLMVSALVRELRREHDVRIVGFRAPDQKEGADDGFMRLLPRPNPSPVSDVAWLLRAAARRRPLHADLIAGRIAGPLFEEIERFRPDVVHVASGRLAGLGKLLSGRPSVLAALDAWHLNVEARALLAGGVRRRLLLGEAARVRRFEAAEYPRFPRIVVVSDADREALLAVDHRLPISVIPNGVDVEAYAPDPAAVRDPDRIVFTGVMSYAPNVSAAELLAKRVYPRVRAARPSARLAIVGRSPAPRVSALAGPGVEVTGEVPDIRPWLTSSRVYACPMVSGTGIKNKLLEAMASGLPCV
ncbi:MAG TPA: glycosyltransferase, partial [Gaiellaceae bacterium]|nr:glycosyltransferase [Gaiellaceae bacterium]